MWGCHFRWRWCTRGKLRGMRGKAIPIFVAFLLMGPIGGIFYNLFPALGPGIFSALDFRGSRWRRSRRGGFSSSRCAIPGLRNAIPSLHMGWTLMSWWYSRGLSVWERAIAMLFVLFTVVATMGTGEHYFIDLVVAFPFVLFLQAMCATELKWNDSRRLAPFAFGLADGARLALGAAIHAAVVLVFGGDSVDPLRADDRRDRKTAPRIPRHRRRDFAFAHAPDPVNTTAHRRGRGRPLDPL